MNATDVVLPRTPQPELIQKLKPIKIKKPLIRGRKEEGKEVPTPRNPGQNHHQRCSKWFSSQPPEFDRPGTPRSASTPSEESGP